MLQFIVFKDFIIELADTALTTSKQIDEKQTTNSRINEQHEGNVSFIPCSVRLNLTITTSEDFRDDPEFLNLKDKLRTHVLDFQQKAAEIIRQWNQTEIKLLKVRGWHKLLPTITHSSKA